MQNAIISVPDGDLWTDTEQALTTVEVAVNDCTEVWRDVPEYEGFYQVSNRGRVRSLDRIVQRGDGTLPIKGRMIKTPAKSNGYLHFKLAKDGTEKYPMVHQLVAAAFIGPRPGDYEVNHIDGDKTNNDLSNLEYVSACDNLHHARTTGLLDDYGEKSANAKLTAQDVREILASKGIKTAEELANKFGVSALYIPLIWRRKRWAHLK